MANETLNFNIGGIDHPVKDPNAYVKPSTGIPKEHLSQEVQDALDGAGSGDGTVTGVQIGSTVYEPTEGVVDISPAIPDTSGLATKTEVTQGLAGKVDKVTGYGLSKNDYSDADKTKLAGIAAGAQVNVINGIKANGASTTLPVDQNGVVELPPASAGGLTEEDISVSSNQDGTVDINVGEDTYTINLNHTHEDMAKLFLCEESGLPSTLDNSTIYAIVDNATFPTEITKLVIHGLEFAGGSGGSQEQSLLPSGYTQCEYVQSSDPNVIVTNISPVGSKWLLDLQASQDSANQVFICSKDDGGLFASVNNAGNFALGPSNVLSSASTRSSVAIEFITDGTIMTINGNSTQRTAGYAIHHASAVSLLGYNGNYKYHGRIYRISCVQNGIFDGIPAKRDSDNTYGIYDVKNDVFYTGNFTGQVIS